MRAVYLTGERLYLRAMVAADKEVAAAWFPGPFPINAPRAEEWLKEEHKDPYGGARHYVIARTAGDEPIGGVRLGDRGGRRGDLTFTMAPWLAADEADALRADALRLLVPWVRDDLEYMTLTVRVAADETATLTAAEELGMVATARRREYLARPGGRVDQLFYQALNPPWRVEAADA